MKTAPTLARADAADATTSKHTKLAAIAEALIVGSLNRFEAERLGDHCLNTTTSLLRARGFPLVAQWEEVPTRFGKPVRVKRWRVPARDRIKARKLLRQMGGRRHGGASS